MVPITGYDEQIGQGRAKACPFCGGKNIWVTGRDRFNRLAGEYGSAAITVGCGDCYSEITHYSDGLDNDNDYDSRVRKVLAKWNARANQE